MSDNEYLQAASVERLVIGIREQNGIGISASGCLDWCARTTKFFTQSECSDELLRRFRALESERDELKQAMGLIFLHIKKGKGELCMGLLRKVIDEHEEANSHDE